MSCNQHEALKEHIKTRPETPSCIPYAAPSFQCLPKVHVLSEARMCMCSLRPYKKEKTKVSHGWAASLEYPGYDICRNFSETELSEDQLERLH